MNWKALVLAVGVGLSAHGASALTYTEGTDLSNVINNTVFPPVTNLGVLASGTNVISGQLGGDCISGGIVNNCQNGVDPQDSFMVTVPLGTEINTLDIVTSSVFGPSGFNFRFIVEQVAPASGGGSMFTSTGVYLPIVVANSITPVTTGLPLAAGDYEFSMFAFGDSNANVVGSYDGVWEVRAEVEPAAPVPAPASILLLASIAGGAAAWRRLRQ